MDAIKFLKRLGFTPWCGVSNILKMGDLQINIFSQYGTFGIEKGEKSSGVMPLSALKTVLRGIKRGEYPAMY